MIPNFVEEILRRFDTWISKPNVFNEGATLPRTLIKFNHS